LIGEKNNLTAGPAYLPIFKNRAQYRFATLSHNGEVNSIIGWITQNT
jgi:hypothetical protein